MGSLLPPRRGSCPRLIVLDFDGTILESVDIKTDAFRELFSAYPAEMDRIMAYHLSHNGISRSIKFKHISEEILGVPYGSDLREATERRFSELVFHRVVACPFVPGAEAFLERFAAGLPVYVVSASPEAELRRVIEARGLGHYFRRAFGSPESKLDHVRRILSREAVTPCETIYVGDSLEDYRVACALGVPFIGRRNKEDLGGLGVPVHPDLVGVVAEVDKRLALMTEETITRAEREGIP